MTKTHSFLSLLAATALASLPAIAQARPVQRPPAAAPAAKIPALLAKLRNPDAGLMVVAHRGCHAPAPHHDLPGAPENSLAALDHCVQLGVDIIEVDVRRTADNHFVMVHDDTMDRTTAGTGRVADLTLAQIKALPLRDGIGGKNAALTTHVTPTLEEFLAHARGRILINLDIKAGVYGDDKDAIYRDVAAVADRLGMRDHIIIKTTATPESPPFAQEPPFDQFAYMPMIASPGDESALASVIARQASGRIKPVAYEVPPISQTIAGSLVAAARHHQGRLWANSLWEGKIRGVGGDLEALRHPDKVWGQYLRTGVSIIQTDEPEALLRFARSKQPG